MNRKAKNFLLPFSRSNRKGLVLALLFFIILSLFLPIHKASAVWWNPLTWGEDIANVMGSAVLKLVGLIFFVIPLFTSALFVSISALILGWIISPDFISLKFTQNPFVDIGLSITRNFANMGFIIFLVAIALATVLRIKEYRAKKTLPVLIIVALLINFSPVFCGVIIDASNIIMNFFLTGITGLTGFINFFVEATQEIYNLFIGSGFDLWANIATFMQVLVMIVFNYFAGFIFILFSTLFIMRYIMLWILVILSPIAFVSYILPITRRGRSLLSWKKWWEQLTAWSIIGIIAAFFLYLGFTMISLIAAAPGGFVSHPDLSWDGKGLGLMNNILPYLIPLVLLWIAYRETKRTSAMFAREVVSWPEKAAKAAAMAGVIAATGGMTALGLGALKKLPGAMKKFGRGAEKFGTRHRVLGAPIRPVAKLGRWAQRGYETKIKPTVERKIVTPVREGVVTPVRERVRRIAREHPEFTGYVKAAGRGLRERSREFLLGYRKEKGRPLTPEELKDRYLKKEGRAITPSEEKSGYLEGVTEKRIRKDFRPIDVKIDKKGNKYILENGKKRRLTPEEEKQGYIENVIKEVKRVRKLRPEELAKKRVVENVRKLTIEEITKQHVIIKKIAKPISIKILGEKIERPGLANIVKEGIEQSWKDWKKKTLKPKKKRKLPREVKERLEAGEITPEEAEWEAEEE